MNTLLGKIPKHHAYVEVFGGSGALLFAKEQSAVEVYNDVDSGLVDFFKLLQCPFEFERFYNRVKLTLFSREMFDEYRHSWKDQADRIERVYQWYVVVRQSFSGIFGSSWRPSKVNNVSVPYYKEMERLPEIVQRVQHAHIEHLDWSKLLDMYDDESTFFYMDPPYVHSTRVAGAYTHEMTDDDHKKLIEKIRKIKGKVMLSGYANSIYDELQPPEWRREDFEATLWALGRTKANKTQGEGGLDGKTRTETIWCNYDIQMWLF